MPLLNVNLSFDQYTDYVSTSFVPVGANGLPFDLTGCSAELIIKNAPTDATPLLLITTTPSAQGVVLLGGKAGTIQPIIYKAAYPALLVGQQRHDFFITWANGYRQDFFSGTSFVNATNGASYQ